MFRNVRALTLVTALLVLSGTALAGSNPKDDFDRLDGTGKSRKKVDVIEWEGNLEIHVYPKGSLAGLALKIDEKDGKKVMVIGYRFDNAPKEQLVRRAILSIPLREPLNAYRDLSADDYDKVIITNHVLSDGVARFTLDEKLKALYPEGHPALAGGSEGSKGSAEGRVPAAAGGSGITDEDFRRASPRGGVDEAGTISPYTW